MSADTISAVGGAPNGDNSGATAGEESSGGAGRGGSSTAQNSPLVVVQPPRAASPPRPAPQRSQANTDNSLRNGYAAISHSVSGETAAIGAGFLAAGPVGAIIGGAIAPVALAAMMYRRRTAEHDANSNGNPSGNGASPRSGSRNSGGSGSGNRGRNNSPGGADGGRGKDPKGKGGGAGGGKKPRPKDPVLDKLGRGLDRLKPKKGDGSDLKGPKNKPPKGDAGGDKPSKGPKDGKSPKGGDPKGLKGSGGLLKDRGKQPPSDRPWHDRGDKPGKGEREKGARSGDDVSSSTARDGLEPKAPKGGAGGDAPWDPDHDPDEIIDAELVDDDLPPKPEGDPDDVIDAEVIDEDRIALVRAKREKQKRRAAVREAKKAADRAARDGDLGDPRRVRDEVLREANRRIDLEIHHEDSRLALAQGTNERRSEPVDYPSAQVAPAGTRQAGAAVARQVDPRTSSAYAILRAMAEQLARGAGNDDDADMGDHIVELSGIPNMCKNLSRAVFEAAEALRRTAPLSRNVVKHLQNAMVAARTAGVMSENVMVVFVQAHREDILRVLEPRIGEERWNIRNAQGTLDAAKLRAAIMSSQQRLALPSGSSVGGSAANAGGRLVPASDASTKRLIELMKGFSKGHMVNVLSEINGSAAGVEVVADSVGKLVRRMRKTWPTEDVVDDTVARTEAQVRRVATELRKAVREANKAHARELRLNRKGRAGKGARAERKWDVLTRRSNG